jgi:hypothetical protein
MGVFLLATSLVPSLTFRIHAGPWETLTMRMTVASRTTIQTHVRRNGPIPIFASPSYEPGSIDADGEVVARSRSCWELVQLSDRCQDFSQVSRGYGNCASVSLSVRLLLVFLTSAVNKFSAAGASSRLVVDPSAIATPYLKRKAW